MITIRINNKRFTDFTEASVDVMMDSLCRGFSITTDKDVKLSSGSKIEVFIDNEQYIDGFIDNNPKKDGRDGFSITATGRDMTCDLVDSCVPDEVKTMKKGINLPTMTSQTINALGLNIKVVDTVGSKPFGKAEVEAIESGAKSFEMLTAYAKKRAIYFRSGVGSIILYRIESVSPDFEFIKGKNVVDSSAEMDLSERYNKYVVKSQLQSRSGYGSGEQYQHGMAIDNDIREGRFLEIVAEENMTSEECKTRAEAEANIRRAMSFSYSVEVDGHSQNGVVYDITKGARVVDKKLDVNGTLLITAVSFRTSKESGDTTSLTLSYPDAFGEKANMDAKIQKNIDISEYNSK